MDEQNPLAELPAQLLAEMTPAERRAYLAYLKEPVPAEVTETALALIRETRIWGSRL
ncbi:hypothetical protein ACFY05_25835 [Microtetraspora fusca]|uniref:Transcriptional regulator n=1 Tax=Microtetraspora fusca TaxID=1997 RepID=A0ABW6VBI9_MICFU